MRKERERSSEINLKLFIPRRKICLDETFFARLHHLEEKKTMRDLVRGETSPEVIITEIDV